MSEDSFNIAGKLLLELWDHALDRLAGLSSRQATSSWRGIVLEAVAGSAQKAPAFAKADANQGLTLIS